ncbi:type VI secretion system baseplate subunit TssF [Litoribrevibacter euphylliae]|uniref:Type VI secretion system baseplate subunit TssF n=1 Tax=Litoribrevibacter euphylliae TaxID=1834034 RepID=A0ABV7HJ16_9GAMM
MAETLMRYYERELAYIRKALTGFAQRHPEQAAKLQGKHNNAEDPNITRLLDGMALLTAKTELRLDEQFPEIVESLLTILYPGYTQILPSYTNLTLAPDPEQLQKSLTLPKGNQFVVGSGDQNECVFTTVADLEIHPFVLSGVDCDVAPFTFILPEGVEITDAVIHLTLSCCDPDARFDQLSFNDFEFFVNGFEQNASTLIELLLQDTASITVSNSDFTDFTVIDTDRLQSRISDPEFQWLPRYGNQFEGFDALRDYFTYSDKGAYFRIKELGKEIGQYRTNSVVISLFVKQLPIEFLRLFDTHVFRLYTVPAVNVFEQVGEPMSYDFTKLSVPVVADSSNDTDVEVVSVKKVQEVKSDGSRFIQPLYGERYLTAGQSSSPLHWQANQHWNELGKLCMDLSIGGIQANNLTEEALVLALDLVCCNGTSPCLLVAGTEAECLARVDLPGSVTLLTTPSAPVYPVLDETLGWRFISLLNTNFHSLLHTDNPTQALKEVLTLCCPSESCRQADAVRSVSYLPQVAAMQVCGHNIFASGTEVVVTLDASLLNGQIALFAQVLNALYQQFCSFDRFIQVSVHCFGSDDSKMIFPRVHGSQLCP